MASRQTSTLDFLLKASFLAVILFGGIAAYRVTHGPEENVEQKITELLEVMGWDKPIRWSRFFKDPYEFKAADTNDELSAVLHSLDAYEAPESLKADSTFSAGRSDLWTIHHSLADSGSGAEEWFEKAYEKLLRKEEELRDKDNAEVDRILDAGIQATPGIEKGTAYRLRLSVLQLLYRFTCLHRARRVVNLW